MTNYPDIVEYLLTKISKVNVNNQKANTGGVLIKTHKGWEDKIPLLVGLTLQVLQSQIVRNNTTYSMGECGLTYASMAIGSMAAPIVQREPLKNERHQLALGDLLIEGFVYHGYLELVPPTRRDETYILHVTPKWEDVFGEIEMVIQETIIGSQPTIPSAPIASIHKRHQDLFDPEAPYVRALHKLQQVKWRVNERVLNTVEANKNKFVSPEPYTDNDAKEQRRLSKMIEWKFITSKAHIIKEWDGFYQSYDVDYRGRMYNKEPFLNFQGNDLAKGMLQFDEAKEITEDGMFWLAVHTACSYNQSYGIDEIPDWCEQDYRAHLESEGLESISVDKMTLNDRAQWTQEHMLEILEWSESNAIQFKAEKPVTFLACCYEWTLVQETGLTCLPVGIDGSNNGWQHLGAISKDTQTGELVGLVPEVIQKDFYVQTAKALIELAKKDERLTEILNSMPMKHIRKGISKRGSMTRAYSAGASKIAENMYFDCKTEDFHEKYGITLKDCNKFARLLIKAIEQVCPGPLQTMKYLQDLAGFQLGKYEVAGGTPSRYKELKKRRKELSRIKDVDMTAEELDELDDVAAELNEFYFELAYGQGEEIIEWDTPSGFKARYEKYTMKDDKPRATLNGKTIRHVIKIPTDKPDIQGFMCGISPNFIHSMDAAHMALVIDGWDGAFGAVHDSFSTHASDVDLLLQTTKDVFIMMYDEDNYFDVIRSKLTNNEDEVEQPTLGDLEIGGIRESDYFFA